MSHSKRDITLAIILTFAAGLSTVIGASVSFCVRPGFVDILPISLAFSAGVMIYVSFVEILSEGLIAFEEDLQDSHPDSYEYLSHLYLSFTFFGGILIGYLLDFIVHILGYRHELVSSSDIVDHQNTRAHVPSTTNLSNAANPIIVADGNDVIEDYENEEEEINTPLTPKTAAINGIELAPLRDSEDSGSDASIKNNEQRTTDSEREENKSLIKTSLITALAIGLHNFPEGLATFVSTLANPTLGVSIAVAIAIHNIPEGIAVAMPIYFATKSKCKAFLWSFVSGIAEPIGGLVGYAIINHLFSNTVFGVLFGFTAGIMIYISFKELLPTARKKDKTDKYTTILVFAGFLVMDISLILFELV